MKKIIKDNNKILSNLFFASNESRLCGNIDFFLNDLTRDIKVSSSGYAGFSKKKYLKDFLTYQLFDKDFNGGEVCPRNLDQKIILEIIFRTIKKCKNTLPSKITNFYIFPSYSSFVKNSMGGVSGYTPWKNTVLVFIDTTTENWKINLEATIVHEFLHSISRQYHKWETLLDSLVFEGLAENFVQDVLVGELSPWSRSLNKKKSKVYFSKLKNKLHSSDYDIYKKVFFGNKEFPLWAGYAIGYNLVNEYLKIQDFYSWQELVKLSPIEIYKAIDFK